MKKYFLIEKDTKFVAAIAEGKGNSFDMTKFEEAEIDIPDNEIEDLYNNKYDLFVKNKKLEKIKKLSTINEEKFLERQNKIIELKAKSNKTMTETEKKQFYQDILSLIN